MMTRWRQWVESRTWWQDDNKMISGLGVKHEVCLSFMGGGIFHLHFSLFSVQEGKYRVPLDRLQGNVNFWFVFSSGNQLQFCRKTNQSNLSSNIKPQDLAWRSRGYTQSIQRLNPTTSRTQRGTPQRISCAECLLMRLETSLHNFLSSPVLYI